MCNYQLVRVEAFEAAWNVKLDPHLKKKRHSPPSSSLALVHLLLNKPNMRSCQRGEMHQCTEMILTVIISPLIIALPSF